MDATADRLMLVLIVSDIALLGARRLGRAIGLAALQGILVGLLALAAHHGPLTGRTLLLAVLGIGLRGVLFPLLFRLVARRAGGDRELEPYVPYGPSLLLGIAMLAGAMALGSRLQLPATDLPPLLVTAALFTMLTGVFLVVARRRALTQCLGYVVLENGIYGFGVATVSDVPALVELGALLDLFLAVLVMGVAIYRITAEFDHMDTDQLDTLKG
jgi:hydrogenase-4 component E